MYNSDQVISGIIRYADEEVIGKLPTLGKWVVGTGIGIASNKAHDVVVSLQSNGMLHTIGLVDENGNIDIDTIATEMKKSADKYGKVIVDLPIIGTISFSSNDIDTIKRYIERM